ncbi:MAG TPA: hypothetical protein ENI80_06960 [Acidiferrobacteraceae bacterium]|nr:hypothetical protein [Acidiferrobacteraceae bacterium]
MKTGIRLEDCEADALFLASLPELMGIYSLWEAGAGKIDISNLMPTSRDSRETNRVGVFFTGGVDSFYTLLKNRDEIDDVIFVHGFDVNLGDVEHRNRVSRLVNRVGGELGVNVIEIETNLRSLLDRYVSWNMAHGAAMAAVAHLLSPLFSRIYIASSFSYDMIFNWGSHPLLDPLWSSGTLQLIHHGCETKRVDKVAYISAYDIVMKNLRVCYKNLSYPKGGHDWGYNCGVCEKCLRTMTALRVAGKLEECRTFARPIDLKLLSRLKKITHAQKIFLEENLAALGVEDKNLRKAIMKALKNVKH